MPPVDIPGYTYAGEHDLSNACLAIETTCFAWIESTLPLIDPVDVGCTLTGGGCLTLEIANKLADCNVTTVWVYRRKVWNPLGPPTIVLPTCAYDLSNNSNEPVDGDQ